MKLKKALYIYNLIKIYKYTIILYNLEMGRKPVYGNEFTSIKVNLLTSILIGRLKKFKESKGEFLERTLMEMIDKRDLVSIQKQLDQKVENQKKWKAQIRQQELGFTNNSISSGRNSLLVYDDLANKSDDMKDVDDIFTLDEIKVYILERMEKAINYDNLLSAEVKYLPDLIKEGRIKPIINNKYIIVTQEQQEFT